MPTHGFMEEAGFDVFETLAPVPSASSIPMLAGDAMQDDFPLHHVVIAQTFVPAPLEGEIFMTLFSGCGDVTKMLSVSMSVLTHCRTQSNICIAPFSIC